VPLARRFLFPLSRYKRSRPSTIVDLAKAGSLERSCSHEIMGLGRKEPSFDHARHSHSRRCDSVSHNRAARANARGLLGRDRDFGRDAIHPRRDADALGRADRRHRRGCVSWSTRGKLLQGKSGRVRGCDLSRWIALHRVSFGEERISLCERYPNYHRSNSAIGCIVDHRSAQIHRSLSRHHRCSRGRGGVARTSTAFTK